MYRKLRLLLVVIVIAIVSLLYNDNCKKNVDVKETKQDTIKQTQVEDTIPPAPFEHSEVA